MARLTAPGQGDRGASFPFSAASDPQGDVAEPTTDGTAVALVWEGGPAAGTTTTIGRGRHVVGRSRAAAVVVADPAVELHHLLLDVDDAGTVRAVQLTGRVPCRVDGAPLEAGGTDIPRGAIVTVGASRLRVGERSRPAPASPPPSAPDEPLVLPVAIDRRRDRVVATAPLVVAGLAAVGPARERTGAGRRRRAGARRGHRWPALSAPARAGCRGEGLRPGRARARAGGSPDGMDRGPAGGRAGPRRNRRGPGARLVRGRRRGVPGHGGAGAGPLVVRGRARRACRRRRPGTRRCRRAVRRPAGGRRPRSRAGGHTQRSRRRVGRPRARRAARRDRRSRPAAGRLPHVGWRPTAGVGRGIAARGAGHGRRRPSRGGGRRPARRRRPPAGRAPHRLARRAGGGARARGRGRPHGRVARRRPPRPRRHGPVAVAGRAWAGRRR